MRFELAAVARQFSSALLLISACVVNAQTGPIDETQGPIRLRQTSIGSSPIPTEAATKRERAPRPKLSDDAAGQELSSSLGRRAEEPPVLSEFEKFVLIASGKVKPVPRLGAELFETSAADGADFETSSIIPDEYVITVGDEITLAFWGSVDADFTLTVDRAGRISIPRVGTVQVAGIRHADLKSAIARQAARVFKNFELSATVGRIRGVKVFVTGAVKKPGAYHLSSLATAISALIRAGGPTASGSYREIEIRRGKNVMAHVDLYDLLLKGDRSSDPLLQSGDVVHVASVGPLVGVLGSVQNETIIEIKPGETILDAVRMAGGFSPLADRDRAAIEPLKDRNGVRTLELKLPAQGVRKLEPGDLIRIFSLATGTSPIKDQNKRVRVEGEVARPGDYVLPAGSSIADALQAAGGLTAQAYVFGTEFNRESVRRIQIENYERALRDLETEMSRVSSTQKTVNAEQAAAATASQNASTRLIERLRAIRPTGRIVLQMDSDAKELPNLALEDGDRLLIPARPNTVGVFGSVFNSGSYLLNEASKVADMLRLAGGPTRGADTRSLFVVRMNGSVVSERQDSGWFGSDKVASLAALPGDTIFVPEELNKTTFMQEAKEWTQILYQFGLGAAALKTIRN